MDSGKKKSNLGIQLGFIVVIALFGAWNFGFLPLLVIGIPLLSLAFKKKQALIWVSAMLLLVPVVGIAILVLISIFEEYSIYHELIVLMPPTKVRLYLPLVGLILGY